MKIGLGGVQTFISEARKTRDLRVGSRIVSDLAKTIGVAAVEEHNARLRRPVDQDAEYWPHQVVLELLDQQQVAVQQIGDALRNKAAGFFESLIKDGVDMHGRLPRALSSAMSWLDANRLKIELSLLSSTLEVYWVAVPFSRNEAGSLANASERLFRLYDDRRHTRTFTPQVPLDVVRPWTCSLCGTRVATVKPQPHDGGRDETWPENWLLSSREKLCALCFFKRVDPAGLDVERVPSTHAVARDRFHRTPHIQQGLPANIEDRAVTLSRMLDAFDDLTSNSSASEVEQRVGKRVWEVFSKLSPEAKRLTSQLSPYYAIVLFDGDHAGEWFSGKRLAPQFRDDNDSYRDAQHQLSGLLLDFAADVVKTAKDYHSTVVYTGGDEGLAIVPLDRVLPWILHLHKSWSTVRDGSADYSVAQARGMTLSLHVSFVHAKFPLQPAIRRVHDSLEQAKAAANRDCVSLSVHPRSGAPATALMRWGELAMLLQSVELFSNWHRDDVDEPERGVLQKRQQKQAPSRLVYKALDALTGYFSPTSDRLALRSDLISELKWLVEFDKGAEDQQQVWWDIVRWLADRGSQDVNQPDLHGLQPVQELLRVIGWLARQIEWKGK